ncbi:hypothetical protein F4780DRAFT_778238 [Xylariomycetidae sp. FL0641]|nr:hypothetical protein F4780DRAFT_778238 [Xylariomycetidae sp. FL0641]
MKSQPTLLGDFLLGRPSPARVAAERQAAREAARERRKSLEAVRAEMRQAAVARVQAPGGVKDRVKRWQIANADAMARADPLATPTEPSEVNIQVEEESVTEEDRVRIKMRQKRRSHPHPGTPEKVADGGETEKETRKNPEASSPPKKRVVSDTNWVKNQKKSPPKKQSPKASPTLGAGSPLPKNFLARPTASPAMSKKIKDWASKIEIPDEPSKRPSTARSLGRGDGIRVRSMWSESDVTSVTTGSDRIIVETESTRSSNRDDDSSRVKSSRTKAYATNAAKFNGRVDDGIRIRPSRSNVESLASEKMSGRNDDGSQARPTRTKRENEKTAKPRPHTICVTDDGIRVRPGPPASDEASTVRARERGTSTTASSRSRSTHHGNSSYDRIEVEEDALSEDSRTPSRASAPTRTRSKKSTKTRRSRPLSYAGTGTTATEDVSDSESWTTGSGVTSDRPSSAPQKSLADIPFGYSAFSELDLAVGPGRRPRPRPKATRQPSFKGATHVLKKAFTEGKKILTEKAAEPPKPPLKQPPSIENWLKDTVDPFVEAKEKADDKPKEKPVEKDWVDENKVRPSGSSSRPKPVDNAHSQATDKEDEDTEYTAEDELGAGKPIQEPARPTSAALKRSRATRVSSSSLKATGKKGFKDLLRDAFRGESSGHNPPPLEYSSYEEVLDDDDSQYDDYQEHQHQHPSGPRRSPPREDDESSTSTERGQPISVPLQPKRRPPTNGFHELSTIMSDADTLSTLDSDLTSVVSDSTVTQTTGLTRSTAVSRRRTQKSGLKRRLTKHSDLVSVLSLPDDKAEPSRSRSLRSARSVRRTSNHLDEATVESLLQEFAADEHLYARELKTLLDGVIPVLLTQWVYNTRGPHNDLFGPPSNSQDEDSLSKAVVHMGISLEKLKNYHRRCPLSDVHRLPRWLETIHAIYDNYLDVWRLGFQGIIVNLAPASPDDNDSLVNAMPRNEEGDVLNEDGDRIDVAHLLKRPLMRIKWITKFIHGYRTITGTTQYDSLAAKWESLQDKARRRNKEENARVVDDDAKNTDTSRTRDLKTLAALDNVRIDRYRQVYAKDSFTLDLRHSNGQRLDCQVELVFRDNQLFKSDPGDLLIRETGSSGRSWLLFAPITGTHLSARQGAHKHELVVMIRGYRDEWFELVSLTTDNEEQVLDWLDILGSSPMPPAVRNSPASESQTSIPSAKSAARDVPLGEKKLLCSTTGSSIPTRIRDGLEAKPKTSSRYHQRDPRTSHGDDYADSSRPLREEMRPDPRAFRKSSPSNTAYRGDGPPPPPVHKTLGEKKSPKLSPPVENQYSVKRRTSSPLKHEYYPSDVSSESSFSASGSESDVSFSDESSDDELEAADMPDTALAISIKRERGRLVGPVVDESVVSLAPSASASQDNLAQPTPQGPEYMFKALASISYWDNKQGCWKDLWPDICSIVTTPGLVEAYPYRRTQTSSDRPVHQEEEYPLIALDLTPLVMLRNSTALDLEIRSPALNYARLYAKVRKAESSLFRFRSASYQECETLYRTVHRARMDNAKYKALEEETRIRAFGQNQVVETDEGSNQRRSWFGRKNSYRASARAPSQSAGSTSHSSVSASSFLKRLMGGGQSFNIAMSFVDRQSRSGSREASLYGSSSSGAPRSPSVSAANSGGSPKHSLTTNNLKIRLHLLVSASKWEDHGNCYLEVTRPDQGTRQNLRKYQGMEKRIIVHTIPKKEADKAVVKLDVVLGSRCFSRLGSRGILLNVWEDVKDEAGVEGVAPKGGGATGNVNKWCFQCSSVVEASWIYGLVTQEVLVIG